MGQQQLANIGSPRFNVGEGDRNASNVSRDKENLDSIDSVPMNKLHEPAPSLKFQQHAFLSTRLLIQVSVAGFHPVAEVDEDHSGRQGNEPRTQDAIRLNRQ